MCENRLVALDCRHRHCCTHLYARLIIECNLGFLTGIDDFLFGVRSYGILLPISAYMLCDKATGHLTAIMTTHTVTEDENSTVLFRHIPEINVILVVPARTAFAEKSMIYLHFQYFSLSLFLNSSLPLNTPLRSSCPCHMKTLIPFEFCSG